MRGESTTRMKIIHKIPANQRVEKHVKSKNNSGICSGNSCSFSIAQKTLPAFAWKANMLPFCGEKKSKYKYSPGTMQVSEFKTRMQSKLDKILEGTYTPPKAKSREALFKMKGEAIKTITGPLELQAEGIEPVVLADLNKQFAKVKDSNDLLALLKDERIPELIPLKITQPASENYKQFMAAVHKGNTTKNVPEAVAIANEALQQMQGETITIPRIELNVSRKGLAIGLMEHLKAGLEYDVADLMYSPYIKFLTNQERHELGDLPKDNLSIDIIQPVYSR